ncbi:c-type cytochrome domain-containing protein [Mongoliitalea lutea]|uniref:Cytochrome c domain-containing protein n=1 Tax=Mongoliitalea lutea TaxID=849756 RepID=A0A8J3CZT6_9BACT|nr:c-type cytochrome domain-containing protein [Mongoliitalea lutea]GHB41293.1 hypothetical protein GCM10008106_23020 [Mongoliitalea lutea]
MQSKNAISRLSFYLQHVLIVLHGLCLVLAFGHSHMEVPLLLEVFGRAHPLLLHFPIVLLLLLVGLLWSPAAFSRQNPRLASDLFILSLCLTGITVLAGLLLAAEEGYVLDEIFAHQWVSMVLFWMASMWYVVWSYGKQTFARLTSVSVAFLTLITGHLGASMTHGEDFLWAPFQKSSVVEVITLEDALAFDHVILPILEQKCVSCHKASKQKGDLRLDGASYILAGGKHGPVIDEANPKNSSLLQRILLPLDHEEHMPPKGKMQLTMEEVALIQAWMDELAPMEKPMVSMDPNSSFFQLAKQLVFTEEADVYSFPFAPSATLAKLNTDFRVIQSIYPTSPALRVSFFGKASFESQQLTALGAIQTQVVELNLSNMPLAEEDLKIISQFENLERLRLNNTGLQGEFLHELASVKSLKSLSLAGNPLSSVALEKLARLDQLRDLFIWNTGLDSEQIERLSTQLTHTAIEGGYRDDGTLYQLNAPIIQANSGIFQDQLEVSVKHPIGNVEIFYTLDNTFPDSANHFRYTGPIRLTENTHLRVRAFADGWLGSEEAQAVFFKAGIKPKRYQLTNAPHHSYQSDGVETLFDLIKGDEDFTSGSWLGFQETNFELILDFDVNQSPSTIAFSLLSAVSSYIFPPISVEIYSKSSAGESWVLLHKDKPEQPQGNQERKQLLLEYPIPAKPLVQIKAVLSPINPLPKWHPGAGQKGWVFVDEVLLN